MGEETSFPSIAATDFFSVEVLTRTGLVRYLVLFVIDLKTRRVEIAGILPRPDGEWVSQIARNLTDCEKESTEHYHVERNHQGLDNRLIDKPQAVIDVDSAIVRHERLGGVLNYCERRAA